MKVNHTEKKARDIKYLVFFNLTCQGVFEKCIPAICML